MAKATKKRTSSSKARPVRRPHRSILKKFDSKQVARTGTKQAVAIAMLQSANGTSITALTEATGWQQHSVRGFLAGVVRKRLGLALSSTKRDGARVYRIEGGNAERQPNGEQ